MAQIGREIRFDAAFQKHRQHQVALLDSIRAKSEIVKLGGGKDASERHKKKGKLLARDRIQKLIDQGSSFLEIGLFAVYGMYVAQGNAGSVRS